MSLPLGEKIGYSELLNVILVDNDVRPAMLIQPADYSEATGADPKTKSILMNIKKEFPNLIQSEKYSGSYQGILISKKSFDNEKIDLIGMGKVLGYPCYSDFGKTDKNKGSYTKEIVAFFAEDSYILPQQLIANVCSDNLRAKEFEDIASNAEKAFKSNKMVGSLIRKVTVKEMINIPLIAIINKLVDKEPLNKDEKNAVLNIIYNLGFDKENSSENQFVFRSTFQYDNPTHLAILLSLLLYYENDPLKPFWPLQINGLKKMKEVEDIQVKWAKSINDVLQRTSINKTKGGKGRKSRKSKKLRR